MLTSRDYEAIFESAPDGVLVVDADGVIVQANATAASMFGWSQAELAGLSVDHLVPSDVRPRHGGHRERFGKRPHARPMGAGLDLRGQRRDGSAFPVEVSLSPWSREGAPGAVICTVRDVSAVRRLQSFSDRALMATEEERLRIAQELHDDTAQRLATLILDVGVLARESDDSRRAEIFERVRGDLIETADGVRRLARGLRPPELEELGLTHALTAYVRTVQAVGDFAVTLETEAVTELGRQEALVAYRIVQEAVTNARRHSGADSAQVSLRQDGDWVVAVVQDQGRGFDLVHSPEGLSGLGLLGMQERAAMVGARLSVESEPGAGTRVEVRVPIQGGPS